MRWPKKIFQLMTVLVDCHVGSTIVFEVRQLLGNNGRYFQKSLGCH